MPDQETQILEFILDRAKFCLSRNGKASGYDEVSAVFRAGADDLVDAQKRLVALKAIRKSKNFEPLAVSFSVFARYLKRPTWLPRCSPANPELFESAAEPRTVFRGSRRRHKSANPETRREVSRKPWRPLPGFEK